MSDRFGAVTADRINMTNGQTVTIGGIDYRFFNSIGDSPALLDSFNRLCGDTFHLSFESVGGDYEPHVLVRDGRLWLGFTPEQRQGREPVLHNEGDTTLFIHKDTQCFPEEDLFMFPVLSHA